jgi:hypothetical protein
MSAWRIVPLPAAGTPERDEAVQGLRWLFREVFGVERSDRQWTWKYFDAPRARTLTFVALSDAGWARPVGHIGAVVLPGVFKGHALTTTHSFDLMVHPEVRGGLQADGVYPSLMRQLAQTIWELETDAQRRPGIWTYGFPGVVPARLAVRMGLNRPLYRVKAHHTDWSGMARPSPWACRVVPMSWHEAEWMNRQWVRFGGLDGRPRSLKDAAYLQWRYAQSPGANYQLWAVKRHGLREKGWLVTRLSPEPQVIDALVPPTWAAGAAWARILQALSHASGHFRWMSWSPTGHACETTEATLIEAAELRTSSLVGGSPSVWEARSQRGEVDLSGGDPLTGIGPLFHPGDTDVF